MILEGRLNGEQKNRLARLLNMMYTASELANEIGFTTRQIYRVYIPAGLPHQRNEKNHILINGVEFRDWIKETYKKQDLKPNEAFCLSCKQAVKMQNPERKQSGRLFYYLCKCPSCGRTLSRIITRGKAIE